VLHSKTKHIERRDLFIRELVSRQVVATKYIATSLNVADALTKPLMRDAFFRHRAVAMGS
jgi:IS1 family transposase